MGWREGYIMGPFLRETAIPLLSGYESREQIHAHLS
jgi:hypothetical protein